MAKAASCSTSRRPSVAPVGLVGKLSSNARVRGVTRASSLSTRRRKPSAAPVSTATGTPCAMRINGA